MLRVQQLQMRSRHRWSVVIISAMQMTVFLTLLSLTLSLQGASRDICVQEHITNKLKHCILRSLSMIQSILHNHLGGHALELANTNRHILRCSVFMLRGYAMCLDHEVVGRVYCLATITAACGHNVCTSAFKLFSCSNQEAAQCGVVAWGYWPSAS